MNAESTGYVHGQTDDAEIARLEKQAAFTADMTFRYLPIPPNARVLDLATGVGAMAALLKKTFNPPVLMGVDLSKGQLGAARKNHPDLAVLRADATRLPFSSGVFDVVHCTWLLEHVPDPVAVLREVRRVLKPGGFCHFMEVDNMTFRTWPRHEAVEQVMHFLHRAQLAAGGNPDVGQVLHRYFAAAGFRRFTLRPAVLDTERGSPAFFQAFIDEFAEIFEGLDESLGPELSEARASASAHLRTLNRIPGGRMRYVGVAAQGYV